MNKNSKFLLLGVSGVLVGTAVVAIPVAVTTNLNNKAQATREQAIANLQAQIDAAKTSENTIEAYYAAPTDFVGYNIRTFNQWATYEVPVEVAAKVATLKDLVATAEAYKAQKEGQQVAKYQELAKSISSAIADVQKANDTALSNTKNAIDGLKAFVGMLSEEAKKNNNAAIGADEVIKNNSIRTEKQATSVAVVLIASLSKTTLRQEVVDFFTTNTAVDDQLNNLVYYGEAGSNNKAFNPDTTQSSELNKNTISARYVSDVEVFKTLLDKYSVLRDTTNNLVDPNSVAFIRDIQQFDHVKPAAVEFMNAFRQAVAKKNEINTALEAARISFANKRRELQEYLLNDIFTDAEIKVGTVQVREYVNTQIDILKSNVFEDQADQARKVSATLFSQQEPELAKVKAVANAVLQKRLAERAMAHAMVLTNEGDNADVKTAYDKVEHSAEYVQALKDAATAAKTTLDTEVAALPNPLVTQADYEAQEAAYKKAKDAVNAAIDTFINKMKEAAVAKYNSITSDLQSHQDLYRKIEDLVNETIPQGGAKVQFASDFSAKTGSYDNIIKALTTLYLQPTNLYPVTTTEARAINTFIDEFNKNTEHDQAAVDKFKADITAQTTAQTTANNAFGLVNTLSAKAILDIYEKANNDLGQQLADTDKAALDAINKYVTELKNTSTTIVAQKPYSDASMELKDALKAAFDAVPLRKNDNETDYSLANRNYDQAIVGIKAIGTFKYQTQLALVDAKLADANLANLPAMAAVPYNVADYSFYQSHDEAKDAFNTKLAQKLQALMQHSVEAFTPHTTLNNAKTAAESLVSTSAFANVTDPKLAAQYDNAVKQLEDALKTVELGTSKRNYQLSLFNTNFLLPFYQEYDRLEALKLFNDWVAKADALVATDATNKKYEDALKLIQNAVWRANTAAYEHLDSIKQGAINLLEEAKGKIKALTDIQLNTANLLAVKRAALALVAKAKEDNTAALAAQGLTDAQRADLTSKQQTIQAFETKVNEMPSVNELVEYLKTWEATYNAADTAKKQQELTKGQTYGSQAAELKAEAMKLVTTLGGNTYDALNTAVQNPASQDISETNVKINSIQDKKTQNENLFKLYRNTQALFRGILKGNPEGTITSEYLNAEAPYSDSDLVVFMPTATPSTGTVRQYLEADIKKLKDLNGTDEQKATLNSKADELQSQLDSAKTTAVIESVYDSLLEPVADQFAAAKKSLDDFVAATDLATYKDAVDKANAALASVRKYDSEEQKTFSNYLEDAQKLANGLQEAEYLKARKMFEDEVTVATNKATEIASSNQDGKKLIEDTVAKQQLAALISEAKQFEALKAAQDQKAALLQAITTAETARDKANSQKSEYDDAKTALQAALQAAGVASDQKFDAYMAEKFAAGAPLPTQLYDAATKVIKRAIVNASVAVPFKEFNDLKDSLAKLTTVDKAKVSDYEQGMLFAATDAINTKVTQVENDYNALQTRSETLVSPELEKVFNEDVIYNYAIELAKLRNDQVVARLNAIKPALSSFFKTTTTNGVTTNTPYSDVLTADMTVIANTLNGVLTQDNSTKKEQLDAYKTAFASLKTKFEEVSTNLAKSVSSAIVKNNNRIRQLASSIKNFATDSNGNQVNTLVTLDGKSVPITDIYTELDGLRKANNIFNDVLPLLNIKKDDALTAWEVNQSGASGESSITDSEILALIYKNASLFYQQPATTGSSSQPTYESIKYEQRRSKLADRIQNVVLPNSRKDELFNQLMVAKTADDIKTIRLALERAEILSQVRKAYDDALKTLEDKDSSDDSVMKLSAETKTAIQDIKDAIAAKDNDATPTDELAELFRDKTTELQVLAAVHDARVEVDKSRNLVARVTALTLPNGVFSEFRTKADATKTFLETWNATPSGDNQKSPAQLTTELEGLIAQFDQEKATLDVVKANELKSKVDTAYKALETQFKKFTTEPGDSVTEQVQPVIDSLVKEILSQQALITDPNANKNDAENAKRLLPTNIEVLNKNTAILLLVSKTAQDSFLKKHADNPEIQSQFAEKLKGTIADMQAFVKSTVNVADVSELNPSTPAA